MTMPDKAGCRVAVLYPRDRETAPNAAHETGRFRKVFDALSGFGMVPEPALYHDDSVDEIRRQLLRVDGVLVWVNPIEAGRDRSLLDAMLRDVAASGVFVSAHPDVILKLGTKEVLYRTRDIGWGCETHCTRAWINCGGSFRRDSPLERSECSSNTAVTAETAYGRSSLQPIRLAIRAALVRRRRRTIHWSAPGTPSGDASRR